ncbi:MAG: mechanosensitive ion channel [Muribaculaceae bacterium]|nr:mechanosensitive ion channel [Muribaculaceae bacterium]
MKRLILLAVALLCLTPGRAVLKERDLGQTLSVLCTELTITHQEQVQRMERFNDMSQRYDQMMMKVMDRSHQIELMLYSQKSEYVFDLAYACNEATSLHNQLANQMAPFEVFAKRYNDQVLQYVHLSKSLKEIPDFILTTRQQRVDRDSCVALADTIAHDMALQQVQIERTQQRAQHVLEKSREINAFAMQAYDDIRRGVFVNGDNSYFTVLKNLPRFWKQGNTDLRNKYRPVGATRSEWRGNLVLFLFLFIIIYVLGAAVLSFLVIRFLVPRRWVNEEFRKKRPCVIIAATAAVFAVATLVISLTLTDHNFMIMATRLLSEYAWLLVAIMLSLIIRLNGDQVHRALLLYTPITVVGLVVFIYRITFMPNTIVNLTFPVILLLCTIWQWVVIRRHNRTMPRADKFYTWVSLLAMVVALVMAWSGYTLMSVQVLIWWIIQLTMIQGITFIYYLLHRYEDNHISDDDDIRQTWFYDALYKMVIPIAATFSVAASIYWAARVFDLTEWCKEAFTYKVVNLPDMIVVSLDRVLALVALGFVFSYVIYLCVHAYILWKEHRSGTKNKAVSLSMNLMRYLGWGVFVYIVMVTLHVNRAGITIVLAGLSTGVGFAMKDTLENLFYGLSLMNGRVRIGDMIECDGIRGRVKNINYQSTMVETLDGSVVAFLNSQLFSKNFKNVTQNHGYELAQVGVGVAYGSQVNQVRQLIVDRLSALDCYDTKKGIQVLFDNFGESSVDLNVVLWTPVATRLHDLALIKENIYDVLNENGIEIPFPQADLHIKPPKEQHDE